MYILHANKGMEGSREVGRRELVTQSKVKRQKSVEMRGDVRL